MVIKIICLMFCQWWEGKIMVVVGRVCRPKLRFKERGQGGLVLCVCK